MPYVASFSHRIDLETPAGLSYETPAENHALSPEFVYAGHVRKGKEKAREDRVGPTSSLEQSEKESDLTNFVFPILSWNNISRADLPAHLSRAQALSRQGDVQGAERMFFETLTGHRQMLGPVHESTIKVTYSLASFLAEQDRASEADKVLDELSRTLTGKRGLGHKSTQQHVLHVAHLLNGWNRPNEALAYLSHVKELIDQNTDDQHHGRRVTIPQSTTARNTVAEDRQFDQGFPQTPHSSDPSDNENAMANPRTSVTGDPNAAEAPLLEAIHRCESNINELALQALQAWIELLKLHERWNTTEEQTKSRFENARQAFLKVVTTYHWGEEKVKCQDVMEKLLELAAVFLKSPYSGWAAAMFRQAIQKAEAIYGEYDEHTIWVAISIGLVYQNYSGWDVARTWFESALSSAMAEYGEDDGITQSLLQARKSKRFSYVTDEGRPFKTIFGVSQMIIRPGRLHLD